MSLVGGRASQPEQKATQPLLSLTGGAVRFDSADGGEPRWGLRDVSLEIGRGDYVVIVGANGAGKSTLLNAVAGTVALASGRIVIDEVDVTAWAEHERATVLGRVFQDPLHGTVAGFTVAENMALAERRGLRRSMLRRGLPRRSRERYRAQLAPLGRGLERLLDQDVALLSGGERQLLSLLLATARQPKLVLLDEHTSALDPQMAEIVMERTDELVRGNALTTIMVTHNMKTACRYGTRLVIMASGSIAQVIDDKSGLTEDDLIAHFRKHAGSESLTDRMLGG